MLHDHQIHQSLFDARVVQGSHALEVGLIRDVLVDLVAVVDHFPLDGADDAQAFFALVYQFLLNFSAVAEEVRNSDGQRMGDHLPSEHGQLLTHIDCHGLLLVHSELQQLLDKLIGLELNTDLCLVEKLLVLHTGDIQHLC